MNGPPKDKLMNWGDEIEEGMRTHEEEDLGFGCTDGRRPSLLDRLARWRPFSFRRPASPHQVSSQRVVVSWADAQRIAQFLFDHSDAECILWDPVTCLPYAAEHRERGRNFLVYFEPITPRKP